ncbi:ABC transporter permease [Halocalculus aciditolerans]|uniref:ABC transporter permease n=1 Tax=Halocalculus aciditolerans TaxID=1383812 RepID=A0A830FKS6_9EURY|nr:ABC transporter permease [Halocalculus aciditolerans]GGL65840.1 ABC transporter permease [Halocalculus aciditolerans]
MASSSYSSRSFDAVNERVSSVVRKYGDSWVGKLLLIGPAFLVVLGLIVFPTFILLSYSLNPFVQGSVQPGVTLVHYTKAFLTPLYQTILFRTLKIAAIVTVIDFVLGFPLAYAAVRKGGLTGKLIVIATLAPLTIDLVVRSFGWFVLLNGSGVVVTTLQWLGLVSQQSPPKLLFNEIGIIVGLVHVMLPFMVFPIINVMHTIPYSLEEAAQNLGANRLTVFTRVLFPLALPGISAGVLITFVVSLASYVTPAMLGGGVKVLPVVITNTFTSTSNWPFASALSIVLVAIALLVIVGYQRALKRMSGVGGV